VRRVASSTSILIPSTELAIYRMQPPRGGPMQSAKKSSKKKKKRSVLP
jgi:hypothetical protein